MTETNITGRDGPSLNESTVRARANRAGYVMRKSRSMTSLDNRGEYMLIEANHNLIVLGQRFDATLGDIADFIDNCP